MDVEAARMIGAGLVVFALFGVGLGIGNIFASLITAVARNPSARERVFPIGILGFALTEAVAVFALLIAPVGSYSLYRPDFLVVCSFFVGFNALGYCAPDAKDFFQREAHIQRVLEKIQFSQRETTALIEADQKKSEETRAEVQKNFRSFRKYPCFKGFDEKRKRHSFSRKDS